MEGFARGLVRGMVAGGVALRTPGCPLLQMYGGRVQFEDTVQNVTMFREICVEASGVKYSVWWGTAEKRLFSLYASPCGQVCVIIHKDLKTGVLKHMTIRNRTTQFNDRDKTLRLTTVDGKKRTIQIDNDVLYKCFKKCLNL